MPYSAPPIHIVTIGKIKGEAQYLHTGVERYTKLCRPYSKITWTEVPEVPATKGRSRDQILQQEGEKLLSYCQPGQRLVALSEHGKAVDSETFATYLDRLCQGTNPINGGTAGSGTGPMMMVIGGPLGLWEEIIKQAHWTLSLSPMTLPHAMVRLVLVEQLYRGFKILSHEPYHK